MLVDQLQRLDNPSAQEQAVADYILAHPAEIEGHTVQSLAKVSFMSASTVMRVCKKLGCSGFRDFRVRFASELTTSSAGIFVSLDRPLLNRDLDEKGLADLLPRFYSRILYETNRTTRPGSLLRAVQLLDAARVVDVYGTGQSEEMGRRFVFSLETQGKVGALHTAPNIHMIEGLLSDMSRVSVLLSHTGDNEMVVNVAKLAAMAEQGVAMIYDTVHMVLPQGDMVLAVSEGSFGGVPTSYYDLWRVEDGKIAEHWDVMETIAECDTWANENGKL